MKTTIKIHSFLSILFTLFLVGQCSISSAQPAYGTTSFATGSNISMAPTGVCTGGKNGVSAGFSFSIFSAVNCAINNATGTGSDGHINLFSTPAGTGVWQEGRIASSDGSQFQLDNFTFSVLTAPFVGKTITVTGYSNGSPVAGATSVSPAIIATGITNTVTVDVSSNSKFDNIDEFRLTPSGTDAQGTLNIQSITVSAPMSTLPVTFLDIKALPLNNGINVSFSTADESSILNYDVQVSSDGASFANAKTIPARNTGLNHYEGFLPGQITNTWIRIRSNEMNGNAQYSKLVYIKANSSLDQKLTIYPNPVGAILNVEGRNNENYSILTLQGIELQKGKVANQQINLGALKSGVYLLKINEHTVKLYKE